VKIGEAANYSESHYDRLEGPLIMTIRIIRVGERLMVEVPEELAEQKGLAADQAVKWISNGVHSIALIKKTAADGLLEIDGRIAKKNTEEEHLLEQRRRAELGDLDAQLFLGMTSKDGTEAAKWLRLAAEQGDRFSMRLLGRVLVSGDGVEKDIADGYFWLFLSASTYSLKSTKQERALMKEECRELQRIANRLIEEERRRIEERCFDWLDAHKLTKCWVPQVSCLRSRNPPHIQDSVSAEL